MIKKHFYSIIARLAVIFIVMTSIPVFASENPEGTVSGNEQAVSGESVRDETLPETGMRDHAVSSGTADILPADEASSDGEEAAKASEDPPYIEILQVFVYDNKDNPDIVTNMYQNGNVKRYGITPEEDEATRFNQKDFIFPISARESAPKIMFRATPNRDDVEFEFERLNRHNGTVEFTTGRTEENFYVCEYTGIYRIHIYATDGSGHELIYYTYPTGLDKTEPGIYNITFDYVGESKISKTGATVYGGGEVTVNGAEDTGVGLHEKAYMFDYPNGQWQESNVLEARPGAFSIATRDRVGNVRTDYIRIYNIDPFPPVTTFEDCTEQIVNGYCRKAAMKVIADDTTGIPDRYISLNGEEWLEGDTVEISENGTYDVFTRDVFGHVSENSIEVTNIDREGPELSWNIEHIGRGGGYCAKEVLHVLALDRKSGLDDAAYSFDGGMIWSGKDSLEISENGIYEICAKDALGNVSFVSSIEVKDIDNKRPEITDVSETRQNSSGIYAASSRITVSANDDESGLDGDAVFFEETGTWSSDMSLTVKRNGVYPFRVRDRVGNMESSSCEVKNIDPDPPQCEIKGNPESLTMSKITLRLEAKDEISGLKSIYMADAKAGVRKLLKEYPCDSDGGGERKDGIDVEITENGEYIFFLSDMCGNEKKESITVTKIIKPKAPSRPEDPEGGGGKEEGGSGSDPGSGKKPGTGTGGKGNETVIIGTGDEKKEKKKGSTSGIIVKNGSVSEDRASGSDGKDVSTNKVSRGGDGAAGEFEEQEEASGNELTDEYDSSGYSTDIFEGEEEEYFAENEPHELEMLPDPDEIETKEEENSKGGIIAATVVLMILGLSALTVFLLSKKGFIDLSEILGKKEE